VRLNAPSPQLGQRLRGAPRAVPPPRPRSVAAAPPVPDEGVLFAHAMEGVARLGDDRGNRIEGPRPAGASRRPVSEEAEALALLPDLVTGAARFDIADTREYIEGAIVGLDPRLVRRLRRGDFAWQAHLDLHGMTAEAARAAVDRFLTEAVRAGLRCVLIVHGRGLNSKDQMPVLKERLKVWLARGRPARVVFAFTSDRPRARRLGGATRHGALLDNAADVLFVLGAASTGATLGLLQSRVPVAIAVSFGAYALASAAGRAEAARAYTRIGHAAGVCNYLLAGLLAAVVARPGPGWGPVLDAAGLVVLTVNGAAAAVQAGGALSRARARPGAGR